MGDLYDIRDFHYYYLKVGVKPLTQIYKSVMKDAARIAGVESCTSSRRLETSTVVHHSDGKMATITNRDTSPANIRESMYVPE